MPNNIELAPSSESRNPLSRPIVVVNRELLIHSTVKKHCHTWGQFVYASRGVLAVATAENRYIVPPEQGVWVTPDTDHEVTAMSDVELTSFYFDNSILSGFSDNCCVLNVGAFFKALILESRSINADYEWSGADGRLLRLIRDKLIVAIKIPLHLPYPKDFRLLAILTKLQLEPSNRNNLVQWGNIVGASARTLSRLFKNETGLTYSEWRQRFNIQVAITQLSSGETVSNISLNLGYESPSSFIYMFRKLTGVTPGFYSQKQCKDMTL